MAESRLPPAERDQILAEMGQFLKGIQGIVTAANGRMPKASKLPLKPSVWAWRPDVEPAIMMKLPLPFKQMGMSAHRDFDAIAQAEVASQTVQRLCSIMSGCTSCHELYRFSAK